MSEAGRSGAGRWSGRLAAAAAFVFGRPARDRAPSLKLALRQAQEQLRAANERLSMVLRAGRAGFFEWNMQFGPDGRFSGSPELKALFDAEKDAPEERVEWWIGRIVPEDQARLKAVARGCVMERGGGFEAEFRVAPPDGRLRQLACQAAIGCGGAGGTDRMIGVVIDITARKRADAALSELNRELERRVEERTAQLERLNAEKEALDRSVSYDLRKPLRAINGFSQILMDEYGDRFDEEGRRRLRIVLTTAQHMSKLIDDLLELSCLSLKTLNPHPLDVEALALSVFDHLDVRDPRREIRLTVGELPVALCDRELTRVVLEQLLENAARFTIGRERAEIEVGGEARGGEICYWIKDNGVGFDMSKVDRLFHAFKRMHVAEGFDGTGVGLALVKRAMELQGGRVWAEGRPGEGATFYFAFPGGREPLCPARAG